ncbi:uncharacterized protein MONBRDRAFT_14504 [Monosiga brevicollis MX1]|uniref:Spectrin alpha chain n=1 Tax=Monosiga brevicollis TaxID=81824 RepID=A9UST9_MONBE|nr:uncharacterized protein MONBRDRAFT_14504 [Monosiga brevicollis MX1]EDQ91836.1 predicted protein [Monosiga brevicollis MX1]|eukprot:XP_001743122.1 hypothetical protein [Monosiga brevicollis MX1]
MHSPHLTFACPSIAFSFYQNTSLLSTVDAIAERRSRVLERWNDLKVVAAQQRAKLEYEKRLQQFTRDADELELWIEEKLNATQDNVFDDHANIESRIKKHEAFCAEVKANENSLAVLKSQGDEFVRKPDHHGKQTVEARLDSLQELWQLLLDKADLKKRSLQELAQWLQFQAEADDLMAWIDSKKSAAEDTNYGRDLDQCDALMKRSEAFTNDLAASDNRLDSFSENGFALLEQGHRCADEIKQRIEDVSQAWTTLKENAATRHQKLADARQIHSFNRDAQELLLRITDKERDGLLSSDISNTDLSGVEALQRKHEVFMRDLAALHESVEAFVADGQRLASSFASQGADVRARIEEVQTRWDALDRKAQDRGKALRDAWDLQRFHSELRLASSRLSDLENIIRADEVAHDVQGAETLLQRHQESQHELRAREETLKNVVDLGNSLVLNGHPDASRVKEGLQQLEANRESVAQLWQARFEEFSESLSLQVYLRDVEQVNAWIESRQRMLQTDDTGDSLDAVDQLLKKQDDFERSLKAQADKMQALVTRAEQLIKEGHRHAPEIDAKRQETAQRRQALETAAQERRAVLLASHKLQEFNREANEMMAWISEKGKTAADPSYQDLTNLRGKLKNHETFEADVIANANRLTAVCDHGQRLVAEGHFAKDEIAAQTSALQDAWESLLLQSNTKSDRLKQAQAYQEFARRVADFLAWCADSLAGAKSEDVGKDLTAVQKLIKRHQLLETDVAGQHKRLEELLSKADAMLAVPEHLHAAEISQARTQIREQYDGLALPVEQRRTALDASLALHRLLRDCADELSWIREKEPSVTTTMVGNSLTAVQNLQKKHTAVRAEIAGREKALTAVLQQADDLASRQPGDAAAIRSRRTELVSAWQALNEQAQARSDALANAVLVQQYLVDANEAEAWIAEKRSAAASENYGKDEDTASTLLKKHEGLTAEIRTYQKTIDALRDDCQACQTAAAQAAAGTANADVQVRALFDFSAPDDRKLSMTKGEHFYLVGKHNSEWLEVRNRSGQSGFVPASYVTEVEAGARSDGAPGLDDVVTKQTAVEQQYQDLLQAAEHRHHRLEESQQWLQFVREAMDVESWMNSKVAIVSQTDVGTDLDHNEVLQKKFDDFHKDLVANESRVLTANSLAEKLIAAQHSDTPAITEKRDGLNERWEQLLQASELRGEALRSAHAVHKFQRDADELLTRFAERELILSSEATGKDVGSVEAAQRKHEAAVRDLMALEGRVQELDRDASALRTAQPAVDADVSAKQTQILAGWENLLEQSAARTDRLQRALEYQKFLAEYRDAQSWLSGVQPLAASKELAKDVNGAATLLKRHEDLQAEIDARQTSLVRLREQGLELASRDPTVEGELRTKLTDLDERLAALQRGMQTRERLLQQCQALQAFVRLADQVDAWMAAREGPLADEDIGTSLDGVEAMVQKHHDFEQSLAAQEEKVKQVEQDAQRLIDDQHYDAPLVADKRRHIQERWRALCTLSEDRKRKLDDARQIQEYLKDANEMDAWIAEKAVLANDPSYKDPSNLESKLQKHQKFEAEIAASEPRVLKVIEDGRDIVRNKPHAAEAVGPRIQAMEDQWRELKARSAEKGQGLLQAGSQQQYNHSVEDVELWLSEVEVQLSSSDNGRDVPSVQNLIKKHELLHADIEAQNKRVKDLHTQLGMFRQQQHFAADQMADMYDRVQQRYNDVAARSRTRGEDLAVALQYHELLRTIEDELAWMKEKERQTKSTDFGKDLTGVQNLQKKHSAFETELEGHADRIKDVSRSAGAFVQTHRTRPVAELEAKIRELDDQWEALQRSSSERRQRLAEALDFQRYRTAVDEELSWVNEKLSLMASEELANTVSGAEALMKKHHAFQSDLEEHHGTVRSLVEQGRALSLRDSNDSANIAGVSDSLNAQFTALQQAATQRSEGLLHHLHYLEFCREADGIEAWIEDKRPQAASTNYGSDLASIESLITKHETFDASVEQFKPRIERVQELLQSLVGERNRNASKATAREEVVMRQWRSLLEAAEQRRTALLQAQQFHQEIDQLFLDFAHQASKFNSWFENAEEDLTDPVRVNSLEEILGLREAHTKFMTSLSSAEDTFRQLQALDQRIKNRTTAANPYTWFTIESLQESWQALREVIEDREQDLKDELKRQQDNDELRKAFAQRANDFAAWLLATRKSLVEGTGTLEEQLERTKLKHQEVLARKSMLKKIEELGAQMEESLILDNRYTEHSTVGLAQQLDQLEQLGMRMQHNLEQQIQARNTTGVSEEQLQEFNETFRYFDKDSSGQLDHQELRSCLRTLGYNLPVVEQGEVDPEFENILNQLDPNRDGYVSHAEFVSFMIARETENVESASEVISAFRAAAGDKPYVTLDDLRKVLTEDQVEFCARHMQPYPGANGPDAFDYSSFTTRIFAS